MGEPNNKNTAPDVPFDSHEYPRDPTFYFGDDSPVFLVGGTLFKFPASVLTPKYSSIIYFKPNTSTKRVLFDFSNKPDSYPGESDENPIKIPTDITAAQFRCLLTALLGRPGDELFMSLLTDAQSKQNHTHILLLRYLNLGDLASRFDLADLARWAWQQLGLVLRSAPQFPDVKLSGSLMLKMLACSKAIHEPDQNIAFDLLAFFRLTVSTSFDKQPLVPRSSSTGYVETCVSLYQKLSPLTGPIRDMVLGCIFPALVSLGHHSSIWKDRLTRDQRSTLYIAEAHLVSLCNNQNFTLDWLETPKRSRILGEVCPDCISRFHDAWGTSFGRLGALNSPHPLEDVSKLVRLPQCRSLFAEAVRDPTWSCDLACNEKMLQQIDTYLNTLFDEQMIAAYASFAE